MKHRLYQFGTALLGAVMMTALCVSCPAGEVPAEETEEMIGEIETFEFTEEDAPFEGSWISFKEEGFKLYFPLEWDLVEPDEEQREDGLVFQALAPLEEENDPGVIVSVEPADGETTLSGVGERIEEEGYIYNGLVKMNDIPCAAYTSAEEMEEDVVGIKFFGPSGKDRLFTVVAHHFDELPSELMTVLMSLTSL